MFYSPRYSLWVKCLCWQAALLNGFEWLCDLRSQFDLVADAAVWCEWRIMQTQAEEIFPRRQNWDLSQSNRERNRGKESSLWWRLILSDGLSIGNVPKHHISLHKCLVRWFVFAMGSIEWGPRSVCLGEQFSGCHVSCCFLTVLFDRFLSPVQPETEWIPIQERSARS